MHLYNNENLENLEWNLFRRQTRATGPIGFSIWWNGKTERGGDQILEQETENLIGMLQTFVPVFYAPLVNGVQGRNQMGQKCE
jgi:hypothetical protein